MDVCFTSTVAPKLITDLLTQWNTISFSGCMSQMFHAHFFGATEIIILVAMAYDHYVAICRPLHYVVIMSVLIIIQLPFCGPNQIDHYFCDIFPLLKLACTDTRLLKIITVTTTGMLSILTFVALLPYIIMLSTLRIRSSEGRHKALSTCGLHITFVLMFFLPLIFTYVPMADSVSNDSVCSVLHHDHPLVQPSHLHTEKCRHEEHHEEIVGPTQIVGRDLKSWGWHPWPDLVLYTESMSVKRAGAERWCASPTAACLEEIRPLATLLLLLYISETVHKRKEPDDLQVLPGSDILAVILSFINKDKRNILLLILIQIRNSEWFVS
ncbi:Olfactory receptor 4S2 [Sciurus carolinensis]|uniref:Olfactory receptor 4S2 n=1 Tax=Sciurus carolinensis TaxID=30640 RepID=A0AA41N7P4_SCICA|nr:Olfactory receptor 4S2 [Sciurus carolinensis]